MKRLLLTVAAIAFVSSCGFNGNRQGETSVTTETEDDTRETPSVAEEPAKPTIDLDKAKELLKELGESIAESMQADESSEPDDEEEEEEDTPVQEGKWYDRDYSITVQDLEGNGTYTFTRIGKKMYFTSKSGNDTRIEEFDILDNGTLSAKVIRNGKYVRSYTLDKTPAEALKLYLASDKTSMRVIGSYPQPVATSKSDTRCGRPCWVLYRIKDESMLGYSTHQEDVYYVDKEYGFIYEKVSSASGNVGVSYKGKTRFRVTAFTDRPS